MTRARASSRWPASVRATPCVRRNWWSLMAKHPGTTGQLCYPDSHFCACWQSTGASADPQGWHRGLAVYLEPQTSTPMTAEVGAVLRPLQVAHAQTMHQHQDPPAGIWQRRGQGLPLEREGDAVAAQRDDALRVAGWRRSSRGSLAKWACTDSTKPARPATASNAKRPAPRRSPPMLGSGVGLRVCIPCLSRMRSRYWQPRRGDLIQAWARPGLGSALRARTADTAAGP